MNYHCNTGLYCDTGSSPPVCTAAKGETEACASDSECIAEMVCSGTGVCVRAFVVEDGASVDHTR